MDSAARVAIIERGVAALRVIEAQRRALLPPPEHDDAALVRELRAVQTIADRLAGELEDVRYDPDSVRARDASLSMGLDEPDALFVLELAEDSGAATPYRVGPLPPEHQRALRALGELLQRYADGEYMPPNSWFGINAPDA
jgi:hypothetical protein